MQLFFPFFFSLLKVITSKDNATLMEHNVLLMTFGLIVKPVNNEQQEEQQLPHFSENRANEKCVKKNG